MDSEPIRMQCVLAAFSFEDFSSWFGVGDSRSGEEGTNDYNILPLYMYLNIWRNLDVEGMFC